MSKRKYRELTNHEKEVINFNQQKVTVKELADILKVNYTNLTGMLKANKIIFKPKRIRGVIVAKVEMNKEFNSKNEKLLTDTLMKTWFY